MYHVLSFLALLLLCSPFLSSGKTFSISCNPSHSSYDDPIVYPGEKGAAHLHLFFGNTAVNYATTADSIRESGSSTCDGGGDENDVEIINRSSYWVAAVVDADDNPVLPALAQITYSLSVLPYVKTFPSQLRMIAGNSSAMTPQGTENGRTVHEWICLDEDENELVSASYIPTCTEGQYLKMSVKFPQCWDGENLDSTDQSHMAYASMQTCPDSHPVFLPTVMYDIRFQVNTTNTSGWYLSSDRYNGKCSIGGYTIHADWFNGWNMTILNEIVEKCINTTSGSCQAGDINDDNVRDLQRAITGNITSWKDINPPKVPCNTAINDDTDTNDDNGGNNDDDNDDNGGNNDDNGDNTDKEDLTSSKEHRGIFSEPMYIGIIIGGAGVIIVGSILGFSIYKRKSASNKKQKNGKSAYQISSPKEKQFYDPNDMI